MGEDRPRNEGSNQKGLGELDHGVVIRGFYKSGLRVCGSVNGEQQG